MAMMIVKLPKHRKCEPKPEVIDATATPEPEFIDATLPPEGPWTAAKLYGRSQANRRVMLLELMAWAIWKVESCEARAEFAAFEQELREVREREWDHYPWPGAKEPERFRVHVEQMARRSQQPHRSSTRCERDSL